MVFNATFNNISVISWRSVLLVEETEVTEKTTDLSQILFNRTNIIYIYIYNHFSFTKIKYIMYNVQDFSIFYDNPFAWLYAGGYFFTHNEEDTCMTESLQ